jgi:hypothetical protein
MSKSWFRAMPQPTAAGKTERPISETYQGYVVPNQYSKSISPMTGRKPKTAPSRSTFARSMLGSKRLRQRSSATSASDAVQSPIPR